MQEITIGDLVPAKFEQNSTKYPSSRLHKIEHAALKLINYFEFHMPDGLHVRKAIKARAQVSHRKLEPSVLCVSCRHSLILV